VSENLYLGIDLGGTKTLMALADEEGRDCGTLRYPTEPSGDSERDLGRMVDHARQLIEREGLQQGALRKIGVSAPGPLDPGTGIVLGAPNLPGWNNVPMQARLEEALGVPTRLDNDANAAALAEWRFGAGKGTRNMAYLTMSTGVGGGLILNGKPYRGEGCLAGELGHVPVEWNGRPCNCGQRGCLEAYIGGAAWQKVLREVTPDTSRVAELAGGREQVRPEHLVQAAKEGDAFALAEMAQFNDYLARAIVGLTFTLALQRVVLGTIAIAAGDALCFDPVRAQVSQNVWPHFAKNLEIVPASLGPDLARLAGICVALDAETT